MALSQGSSIEVVEVVVDEGKYGPKNSSIDLRLQNTGNELAVIKDVHLKIEHLWELKNIPLGHFLTVVRASSALSSTGDYEVQLPRVIDELNEPVQVDTPHQIKGGEADRFTVSFTHNDSLSYVYHIKGWVTYDDKVSKFPGDLMILVSQNPPKISHIYPNFYMSSEDTSFKDFLFDTRTMRYLYLNNPGHSDRSTLPQEKTVDLMLRNSDLIRWANMPDSSRIDEIEKIASSIPEKRDLLVDLLKESVNNYLHNRAVLLEIANVGRRAKVTPGRVLHELVSCALDRC